eukprot:403371513
MELSETYTDILQTQQILTTTTEDLTNSFLEIIIPVTHDLLRLSANSYSSRYLQDNTTLNNQTAGSNETNQTATNQTTGNNNTITNVTNSTNSSYTSSHQMKQNIVHIANFTDFFAISSFFIIFFATYFIMVPLIMKYYSSFKILGILKRYRKENYSVTLINFLTVLWLSYLIFLPILFFVIWGMKLAFDDNFSYQFGFGIMLIGLFVQCLFLGFANWYGHNWFLTKGSIALLISAGVFAALYCFVVIFLPDYFTYNGTTSIILSANYIIACYLIYTKDFDAPIASSQSDGQSANSQVFKFQQYVNIEAFIDQFTMEYDIHETNNNQVLDYVFDKTLEETAKVIRKKRVSCWISYGLTLALYIFLILVIGQNQMNMLIGFINTTLILFIDAIVYFMESYKKRFYTKDKYKCLLIFIARLLSSFLPRYWMAMQSITFYIISIVIVISFIDKLIYRSRRFIQSHQSIEYLYEISEDLKKYVQSEYKEIRGDYENPDAIKKNLFLQFLSEFIYIGYFVIFILLLIISTKDFVYGAVLDTLHDEHDLGQWILALISVFFSIITGLFYAWYLYFKEQKYILGIRLYVGLVAIETTCICLGVFFYSVIPGGMHIIWTSFIILPGVVMTYMIFLGKWIANDYQFYQKGNAEPQQNYAQAAQVSNGPSQAINNNNNFDSSNLQSVNGRNNQQRNSDIFSNFNSSNLNNHSNSNNQAIPESKSKIKQFKKLFFDFDQKSFFKELCEILACKRLPESTQDKITICTILANIVVNIFYIILTVSAQSPRWVGFTEDKTLAFVALFFGIFGAMFIVLYFMASLKYWKLQDKKKVTADIIVIYTIAYFIIGGLGIFVTAYADTPVWGHYIENKQRQKNTILIYSKTLFPTLKFDYNQKKMKKSNSELIYFFSAAFTFFTWSFLASILLQQNRRYIGISLTAYSILAVFVYSSDRVMRAIIIDRLKYKKANIEFFRSSLAFALTLKQRWRDICMNKKTMEGSNGDDASSKMDRLPPSDQIRPQLVHHYQWQFFMQDLSQKLENQYLKFTYFNYKPDQNQLSHGDLNDERFDDLRDQFNAAGDNDLKRIDVLLQVEEIYRKEQVFETRFYAFLKGYMRLKLKNLVNQEKTLINTVLEQYKLANSQDQEIQNLTMITFHTYLLESPKLQQFERFLDKYQQRSTQIKRQKTHVIQKEEDQDEDRKIGYHEEDSLELDDANSQNPINERINNNLIINNEDIQVQFDSHRQEDQDNNSARIKHEEIVNKIQEEFQNKLAEINEEIERQKIQEILELQRIEEEQAQDRIRKSMIKVEEQIQRERLEYEREQERKWIEEQLRRVEEVERQQRMEQLEIERQKEKELEIQHEQQERERIQRSHQEQEEARRALQEHQKRIQEELMKQQQAEEQRKFREEQEKQRRLEQQRLQEMEKQKVRQELERKKREFEEMKEKRRQEQIQKLEEERKKALEDQKRKKQDFENRRKEREQKRQEQIDEERRQQQQASLAEEQKRKHQEDQRRRQMIEIKRKQEEEKRRQEEEHQRRQEQYNEERIRNEEHDRMIRFLQREEEDRKRQENQNSNNIVKDNQKQDMEQQMEESFIIRQQNQDENFLKTEGDKIYSLNANKGVFQDPEFDKRKALGKDSGKYQWTRVRDIQIDSSGSGNRNGKAAQSLVFDDGVSACDILQGSLGDCYLLSAMSVIAHSQPQLMRRIFHQKSQEIQDTGLYVLMFYRNRKPVIITLDDYFPTANGRHAYVKVSNKEGNKEIWAMLIEKAYAKMYGSYPNIEGGLVDAAFADLTNGAPDRYDLTDQNVKRMLNTGQFWEKLNFWNAKNYLMGAGSPQGSDADVSRLGIVQGHAYSILDVYEVEGNKLIQLRNPWGDRTEWKGAWSDQSKEWTDRRKRIIYDRMQQRGVQKAEVGEIDGIFWMNLNDFFSNFEQLFLCRFFSEEWTEISYRSEWSTRKGTAGGCSNNTTVGQNPQLQLLVDGNNGQAVEIFMFLQVETRIGAQTDRIGVGFEVYDMKGKKITSNRGLPKPVLENHGGYQVARDVSLDSKLNCCKTPYTLLLSTYDKNQNAKFTFTMWFKNGQGKVSITEF